MLANFSASIYKRSIPSRPIGIQSKCFLSDSRFIHGYRERKIMMAVRMVDYGRPLEVLRYGPVDIPTLKSTDVCIAIRAASVNPLDLWMCRGYGRALFESQRKLPVILGRDCSGIVVDVGSNVWDLKVGDEVICSSHPFHSGCYAQYITISERSVVLKPKCVSHIEASTFGFTGLTVWNALITLSNVKRGQNVLILGGSGGIGTFALQLLKHYGCRVTVTCKERHKDKLKSLGADSVLFSKELDMSWSKEESYQAFDLNNQALQSPNILEEFDVVLDCVGKDHPLYRNITLRHGGHLISLRNELIDLMDKRGLLIGGASALVHLLCEKLVRMAAFDTYYDWAFYRNNRNALESIAKLVDLKVIKAVVDGTIFPLEETAKAMEYVEQRQFFGKVVLEIPQQETR